eukprot:TRINITY_DN10869_c0_g1_i2.p1 TRINITY_DN10869_c0_g1~~TRINITY_DN10869_c0_g1_i2.p1  ORF type:complete len:259 (+),score=72.94 TRINITY_DN10869_c0_g1_i2:47-778(+)
MSARGRKLTSSRLGWLFNGAVQSTDNNNNDNNSSSGNLDQLPSSSSSSSRLSTVSVSLSDASLSSSMSSSSLSSISASLDKRDSILSQKQEKLFTSRKDSTSFCQHHQHLDVYHLVCSRVFVLNLLPQVLLPSFYLPLAYFWRYSYNGPYYPYANLPITNFVNSLYFVAITCASSLLTLIIAHFIIKHHFHLSFLHDIIVPLALCHKEFVIYCITCGISVSLGGLIYHNLVYFAFSDYRPSIT